MVLFKNRRSIYINLADGLFLFTADRLFFVFLVACTG